LPARVWHITGASTSALRFADGSAPGHRARRTGVGTILLAQLTDLHLQVGPDDLGAAKALERAVAALLALDPQPDAVLVTGDLTDDGDPRSYARVRELLAPLTIPVHPIPGNHDDRDALRAAFADHPGVAGSDGFVQYATACGPLRVLMLDTLLPGSPAGRFDEERRAWLAAALDDPAPTLIAMHHPPIPTGIGEFDTIGLPDGDVAALATLLRGREHVLRVTAGHIHRVITATVGGGPGRVPVFVSPSAWRQAVLDLGPQGKAIVSDGEPAGYALHLLTDDGALVTHAAVLRP
jgi:3',5'-cyclic AMP phosphodiesterase CpdA